MGLQTELFQTDTCFSKEVRLFEAFSGYGSQRLALRNIGANFRSVGISEIDKFAIQAYSKIHGSVHNFGDISTINWSQIEDFDLFTYSFPCTDISLAGKQLGLKAGSGTRSSLLWDCERAIDVKRPTYLLMENVKALVGKRFLPDFLEWQDILTRLGYTNFIKVLNARNYGVAQHRERVFMISILGGGHYKFPDPIPLNKRLSDYLDQNVDSKYYLRQKGVDTMIGEWSGANRLTRFSTRDVTSPFSGTIVSNFQHGVPCNCLTCFGKCRYGAITCNYAGTEMCDTCDNLSQYDFTDCNCISKCLRRFTPKECFALMGVYNSDFNKLKGISDVHLYRLAGNSIVVPVLEAIFKNLNL